MKKCCILLHPLLCGLAASPLPRLWTSITQLVGFWQTMSVNVKWLNNFGKKNFRLIIKHKEYIGERNNEMDAIMHDVHDTNSVKVHS